MFDKLDQAILRAARALLSACFH